MKHLFSITAALCGLLFLSSCDGESGSTVSGKCEDCSSSFTPDGLEAEDYRDTSATGIDYNSGMGTATIVTGTVYDSWSGDSYKTIQFGPYVWMAENVNNNTRGICYKNDSLECKKYGRLYQVRDAPTVCPEGFDVPSQEDYQYMFRFAGKPGISAIGFNVLLGGSCVEKNGKYSCSDAGMLANMLTRDDLYLQTSGGSDALFKEAASNGYYSLRCMKYSFFVESKEMLPTCNSDLRAYDIGYFFVASAGANFYCNGKKWIEVDNAHCPSSEKGRRYYYGDSLYVCDGEWKIATMNDMDEVCADSNAWTVMRLNKEKYVCDNGEWRKLTKVDQTLGLCTPKQHEKIDYIAHETDTTFYYCDSTGWRMARLTDFIGNCDSSTYYKVARHRGEHYTCRTSDEWDTLTSTEKDIGVCAPRITGKIDTIKAKFDTTLYYCDSTYWRKATVTDMHGVCDSAKHYKQAKFMGISYTCRTSGRWETLTWKEDSLGVCAPRITGKIDTIKAKLDTTLYYCDSTDWREATVTDVHGVCDSAKHYKHVKFIGINYTCRTSGRWETLTSTEKDIGVCTPSRIGKIDTTASKADYYCDSTGWRTTVVEDYFGECTEKQKYTTLYFKGSDYGCENGPKWTLLKYPESDLGYCIPAIKGKVRIDRYAKDYICDSVWRVATKEEVLGACTEARDGEKKYFGTTKYICAFEEWRKSTTLDDSLGVCSKATLKKMGTYKSTDYVCLAEGWSVPTLISVHDSCTAAREYEVVEFNGEKYGCRNKAWYRLSGVAAKAGYCTPDREGEFVLDYDEYGYICEKGSWNSASVRDALGPCESSNQGEKVVLQGSTFFCARSGLWQRFTKLEEEYGECYSQVRGKIVTHNGKNYGCSPSRWREVSALDEALGFCDGSGFTWKEYGGIDYVCGSDHKSWTNSTDWAMYGSCDDDYPWKYGLIVGYEGKRYYCDKDFAGSGVVTTYWREITPVDSAAAKGKESIVEGICKGAHAGDTVTYQGSQYYCGLNKDKIYKWMEASRPDQYLGTCGAQNVGAKGVFQGFNVECLDGNWRRDSNEYGSVTDSRDGTRYKTIQIGKQVWMAENLKYEVPGSWCAGNYNGCSTYGRLYNWATAMNLPASANTTLVDMKDSASFQGLCPTGWRIPLMSEWEELYSSCPLGGLSKTMTGYDSTHTDVCGFSDMDVGYINVFYRNGIDYTEELDLRTSGHWTMIQTNDTTVVVPGATVYARKKFGFSLRCIKK